MPVHAATTSAMSSSVTSSREQSMACGLLRRELRLVGGELLLQLRGCRPYWISPAAAEVAAALGLLEFGAQLLDLLLDLALTRR